MVVFVLVAIVVVGEVFVRPSVEDEIAKIHQKRIDMPLGGSLVIEQTEALVAIDVNSGNFRAENNAEETAFQMNMHAAKASVPSGRVRAASAKNAPQPRQRPASRPA